MADGEIGAALANETQEEERAVGANRQAPRAAVYHVQRVYYSDYRIAGNCDEH